MRCSHNRKFPYLNYNITKYIAILYALVIIGWIVITAVMQFYLYPVESNYETVAEGLDYYQDHRGYMGLDHGTKGVVFLISSLAPLLFLKFSQSFKAKIGAFFGSISFLILSTSFFVQAFTAEYIISLLNNTGARTTGELIYIWIFLEGGITHSTYLIANILIGVWVILHSYELKKLGYNRLYPYGIIVAMMHILASVFFISQFIVPNDIGSQLTDIATFLFIVWFIIYGFVLDQRLKLHDTQLADNESVEVHENV